MFSDNELQISNKSYTNKDFQTIYPELVEIVQKLTNRWDPASTNESDPGVVLLKLLAFVADKENYNIDKNILEAFLPSATQETSFRNLTEMNGYTMKYYESATTNISVVYNGILDDKKITLPCFETQFSDTEGVITYTLVGTPDGTGSIELNNRGITKTGLIAEGTPNDLNINGNTSIQLTNLDSNNRLFFPEPLVAENQIFVKNEDSTNWFEWQKVPNLNTIAPLSPKFKFGFDSNVGLPYIQFPDDIAQLIGNGLNVKYIVTSGKLGNIPARKLTRLSNPNENSLKFDGTEESVIVTDETTGTRLLVINNIAAATNGNDPETLDDAYNNFKKTVGTFDVLVTTRDFANYLYNYLDPKYLTPTVSNIQVSDRRTDINYVLPVVSYNDFGAYIDYKVLQNNTEDTITPFDLVLYPLQNKENINSKKSYDDTFTINRNGNQLPDELDETGCISHTYLLPSNDEWLPDNSKYLYKNYYYLNAKISTTNKVNDSEEDSIISNIKSALYTKFQARNVDYGEEIPYDIILDTIQNADIRIKNVSLDEPIVETYVLDCQGKEHLITEQIEGESITYQQDMIARNVLAGRTNLYQYDNNFDYAWGQHGGTVYKELVSIKPSLTISGTSNNNKYDYDVTLDNNQVVQLFAPNYGVVTTATVGVNYYFSADISPLEFISKGSRYQLKSADLFVISYTNSSGDIVTKQYEAGDYIQPNFNLHNTTNGTVIVEGYAEKFTTLDTKEEISIVKEIKVELNANNSPVTKMYWSMNNSNNELFDTSDENTTTYSTMLQNNEFVVFTDSTMSQLEIFGSGTLLQTNIQDNWTLDIDENIDANTFNTENIATFNAINWKTINLTNDDLISFSEQQFLTLTSGDKFNITGASFNEITSEEDLTNAKSLEDAVFKYTIVGEDEKTLLNTDSWKIYSRLDIDAAPNKAQELHSGESILLTYNGEIGDQTTITSNYIMFNTPLTLSTTQDWNLGIVSEIDEETGEIVGYTYPLQLFNTSITELQYLNRNNTFVPIHHDSNNNLIIEVSDLKYTSGSTTGITLGSLPGDVSEQPCRFMIYYVKSSNPSTIQINGATQTTLNEGINNYTIDSTATNLTILVSGHENSTDKLIISPLKVCTGENDSFNVSGIETSVNALLTKYCGSAITWYQTYSVPNSKAINSEDFSDSSVFWDKNNIANKFVLPQIKFATFKSDDGSKFTIVKSSKL